MCSEKNIFYNNKIELYVLGEPMKYIYEMHGQCYVYIEP